MTNPVVDGIELDPDRLQNFGWIKDILTVRGQEMPRLIAYMMASVYVASDGAEAAVTAKDSASIAASDALDAAERAEAAGAYVLPALGAGDAGKVVTALVDNTYGLVAPANPAIATAGVAGLVKGGGNVTVAADGTMTATMAIKKDGVALGSASTVNFQGTGFTVAVAGGVATVTSTAAAAAVYWRVRATADSYNTATGAKGLDFYEVQMFATADGSGGPLSTTAVTASSALSGYPATRLVDGNTATDWATADSPATYQYFTFQFASATPVRVIKIWAGGPVGSPYIFTSGVVECSANGTDWTTVATINPPATAGAYVTYFIQ